MSKDIDGAFWSSLLDGLLERGLWRAMVAFSQTRSCMDSTRLRTRTSLRK